MRDLECRIANQRRRNEDMRKKLKEKDDILKRARVDPVYPKFTTELKLSSGSNVKLTNQSTKEKVIKKIPPMAIRIKNKAELKKGKGNSKSKVGRARTRSETGEKYSKDFRAKKDIVPQVH